MDKEKAYMYWLLRIPGIGLKSVLRLMERFKTAEAVFHAEKKDLFSIQRLRTSAVETLVKYQKKKTVMEEYETLKKQGIMLFLKGEEGYLSVLEEIYDAPAALFFRGKVLPDEKKKRVAIVGARDCSYYGSAMADRFAKILSDEGVEVVSGLARGVDACAHKGALKGKSPTFAVLGCGIDVCYPEENRKLFQMIQEQGGIYSEYPPGYAACSGNFPMRNRIISGISDGILVVEAKKKSGSLITADYGLEQGKSVYAVPGRLSDVLSEGCNHLIAQGALLVESPRDILFDLEGYEKAQKTEQEKTEEIIREKMKTEKQEKSTNNVERNKENSPFFVQEFYEKRKNLLETREKIVYASLSLEPKHINWLLWETGYSTGELMESLGILLERQYIKEISKNYFVLL